MKKRCFFNLFMLIAPMLTGCLEYEAGDTRCDCRAVTQSLKIDPITGEWEMNEDDVIQNDECNYYTKALKGQWDGLGMTESHRLVFHENGEYDFYTKSGSAWDISSSGNYWVTIIQYRGKPYPELHMTWPDSDDYPIRFHFEDNVLHLEEPTDGGEPEMRYVHIVDDALQENISNSEV